MQLLPIGNFIAAMNAVEFNHYIQNPEMISAGMAEDFEGILESYPCFQAAMLLYLKALGKDDSADFSKEMERIALSVPDRRLLYVFLRGDAALSDSIISETNRDSFELINAFLVESGDTVRCDEGKSVGELLRYDVPVASEEYLQGRLPEAESSPKLKHQDLIDSFLESNSKDVKTDMPQIEGFSKKTEGTSFEEEGEVAIRPLDKSYFTETLARIYVKQKRYDKALQIIKNLSLKYPEKNIYFADQLRFLEKLIINTKK